MTHCAFLLLVRVTCKRTCLTRSFWGDWTSPVLTGTTSPTQPRLGPLADSNTHTQPVHVTLDDIIFTLIHSLTVTVILLQWGERPHGYSWRHTHREWPCSTVFGLLFWCHGPRLCRVSAVSVVLVHSRFQQQQQKNSSLPVQLPTVGQRTFANV